MLPQEYETEHAAASAASEACFTDQELARLSALRRRFQQDQDLFSERELARLRFLRWMCETGRLAS
jgi:hypothetical protein